MSQSAKDAERKRIEAATAAFLANGGTITQGTYAPDEYGGKPEYEVVKKTEKREKGKNAPGWKKKRNKTFDDIGRAEVERVKARKARRKAKADAIAKAKTEKARQEEQPQEKAA